MLRRDTDLSFAGGMWVFPGGRIDPEDHPEDRCRPPPGPLRRRWLEAAARHAAVREAAEEAGLHHRPGRAAPVVALDTPAREPEAVHHGVLRRAARADDAAEVVIDDGEIRDHRWVARQRCSTCATPARSAWPRPRSSRWSQLLPHRDAWPTRWHADGRRPDGRALRDPDRRRRRLDGSRCTTATRPTSRPDRPGPHRLEGPRRTALVIGDPMDLTCGRAVEPQPDAPLRRPSPCVDCGGTCHLLQPPVPGRGRRPSGSMAGDIVAYRCEDCLDRWDIELE